MSSLGTLGRILTPILFPVAVPSVWVCVNGIDIGGLCQRLTWMWQKFYCKVQWIVCKLIKHFINSSPFTHFHQAVAYMLVCSRWNLPILHIKVCLHNLGSTTCENIFTEPFVAPRRSVKYLWVRICWGYKCENEFIPANTPWKRGRFSGVSANGLHSTSFLSSLKLSYQ